jgi:RNA polymerase sigma-B factor
MSGSGTALIAKETRPASDGRPRSAVPTERDHVRPGGPDDTELLGIVRSLPRGSERRDAACAELVTRYRGLVWSCVRRYRLVPETVEDLVQVGYVGLVKAINNFDPEFGCSLTTYARPYIIGEIKRHFRDGRWQIHVSRSAKELAAEVRVATSRLAQDLGRTPSESDLCRDLGVSSEELRDAEFAARAFLPFSLDAMSSQPGARSLFDLVGDEDPRLEHVLGMQSLAAHFRELPAREQKILVLRFYDGMTQAQIGSQFGISQMHVSRLIAHALGYLRERMSALQGRAG